ncbi:hypothetical protein A1Q2_03203 [Trichosporon asahii var. asahii CBS 8904]|uniref:Uncharacterized protein n=2 Tax=Trichosporon asahii var. asahii TaxID=189963 RepID=K1W050_TRIAC|nr:hypothetical protein A1Q1_06741 [Trichosporon asahii var. asahii CBS 2479]EJT52028.1 hypothetical protein A1Q1_06741 [Trichosporon asahii var. asahii CBS 2479]EKD02443.1 hypothetical protein A1Q2_03203 [Trichosporon asahii var. asahii CBS 8904]
MLSTRPPSLLKRLWLSTLRPATVSMSAGTQAQSASTAAKSAIRIPGPVETSMQQKLMEAFKPQLIRISNDSSKHSHHAPMKAIGGGSGETHFAVAIVSSEFAGKTQIARHRLVNSLLKDEFDNMGLHALSLRLKTPEEWEGEIAKAQAQ